ncbi:hypothetical protein EJB05_28676, partial [Eragrostis curvula]
ETSKGLHGTTTMKEGLLMCFMSTSMKNTGARTAGSLRVGEALSLSSMKSFHQLVLQKVRSKRRRRNSRILRDYRKNSGGGWNDSLCMINATPEEWERLCKSNPNLKFRKKSFPLYYNIEKLYEGSIATGDLNFTSTEAPEIMPPTSTEPINLDDPEVGMNPFSANFEGRGPSNDTINFEEDEHTTSSCSGQKVAGNGKKRKQSQVASVLKNFVDFRVKQTKDFMDELNENTKPNEDYSIKNCLAVIESIDELSEMEKAKAAKIFKCEQNRKIVLNLKNPGVRLLWIQDEISPRYVHPV